MHEFENGRKLTIGQPAYISYLFRLCFILDSAWEDRPNKSREADS